MSYVQGDWCLRMEINVFGKSLDYNTAMQRQEKRQLAESEMKEAFVTSHFVITVALCNT